MIVVAISGHDAVETARYYVETWRRDGSAVLSPFLGDLGLDQADWVSQTDEIVGLLDPDTVVAACSADVEGDLDAAHRYGETLHIRTWESEWYSDTMLRTHAALRIDAWRRRGRR